MNKELKSLRIKNGFTQQEIAEFFSMPLRTYQNYEEGVNAISNWVFLLLKEKLEKLNKYSFDKGIYKVSQIKFLTRDIFKDYRIVRVYLYDDYATKNVKENSPIKLLIKSQLDDFSISFLKNGLEEILSKRVEILNYKEFDIHGEFIQNILKKGILIYRSY